MLLANELESITLPNGTTQALAPAVRGANPLSSRTFVCWVTESTAIPLTVSNETFALGLIELFHKLPPTLSQGVSSPLSI